MNIIETNIRKNAHNFKVMVTDKGALVYAMDDNEPKHARTLKDGKLYFIGIQEVVVRGELQEWESMELPKEDYKMLVEAQTQVKKAMDEEQTMARLKREDKSDIVRRVDKWKKRIRHYRKERKGERIPYAIHDFTIGAQSYRFYERRLDSSVSWDGIVINPAYKVDKRLPGTGAVPIQRGELTFWLYHMEEQGWGIVRELTLNEMICVEIIHSYGMVREGKI